MNKQTANILEQHFDTAFSAPDGIKKLRELILTLAMQGKLVEQDPNDPPASELLKEIEAEKQRLVKAGKIKNPKPLLPIKSEELFYDLPKGWEWVRLGEIGIINPRNNADASVRVGFVPMPLINEGFFEKHQFEERQWGEIKKGYTHFADGDVGMAKITPCFENAKSCVFSGLPNGIGAGTTELHIFRNSFNSVVPRFLLYYLKNPNYISKAVQSMTGSAGQKRVTTSYFIEQLFPLPPLTEQYRIVARIDQLMVRCDELEKLRNQLEEKRLAVHAAAIRQLLDAPDGSAWDFIRQHFNELYSVKENVAELRKAILQLAVMGRLVPQDPNDPPASELLKDIEKEKALHEATKSRRKGEKLPPIKAEEMPYELPQGWEWVRLGNISLSSDSGWSPQCLPEQRYNGQWGILKVSAVSWGKFNPDENKALPFDQVPRPDCEVKAGDFLLSRANTDELVARSVIVEQVPEKLMMSDKIVRFKLSQSINKHYINFANSTDCSRSYYMSNASGTSSSMKNVSRQVIAELPIPLPPFPEQQRIVARIDQLMALCDQLDQQINAATGKQTELLNAVMAQVE
ncbi:MAG: restriction endonuclease subunit S [Desulfuromonadales bacterium]|nr:restriction endonuclease subunit S [Desulfuromonadales bacterium]